MKLILKLEKFQYHLLHRFTQDEEHPHFEKGTKLYSPQMQEIGLAMVASMSLLHSLPVSKSQWAQGLTTALLSVLQFVLVQAKKKQRALTL